MRTAAEMVAEAKQQIENLTAEETARELEGGDVVIVDIREPAERAEHGAIPGAVEAPRGMLEFWADPSSPYHREEFQPDSRVILHCQSGGRSALAAAMLKELGYERAAHLDSGFKGWKEAGHPVEGGG